MADLIILVDGGGDIGYGHLMRCLAIKNTWNNGTARLLAQMEGGAHTPDGAEAFEWLNLAKRLEQFATTNTILLVDSYRLDADYFRILKSMFLFVVAFDDYNRISYPVDLVICPGVYGEEMDYSDQNAVTVGGAEYVILRPEVTATPPYEIRESIKQILITFGGSQKDELFYQYVNDIIEEMGFQITIITGNDYIAERLSTKKSRIYGRLEPIEMTKIMASVDIVISAAGQTLNEATWLGIPTISIKTGKDQLFNWDFYKANNLLAGSLVPGQENFAHILITTLENLKFTTRKKYSSVLKKLLPANGAENICKLIVRTAGASFD